MKSMKARRGVLFLFLTPLLVPLLVTLITRTNSTGTTVYSNDNRVAVQRLSALIQDSPHQEKFKVFRYSSRKGRAIDFVVRDHMNRWTVFYDRSKRNLRENHDGTGCVGEWEPVSDAAIHAVAQRNGIFRDLEKHGAKLMCP